MGLQFYLATTVASAMYILGAVEILTTYIAPSILIGTAGADGTVELNARIYGTVFLILMCAGP